MIRKTFTLVKANEYALANVKDLWKILQWNEDKGIKCFRISSELFPRMTDKINGYKLEELSNFDIIKQNLKDIGKWACDHGHVLSMHPGPYTCIASDRDDVVSNSIAELEMHGWIAETLCANAPDLTVNINWHIGRNRADGILDKFLTNWDKCSESVKKRTCIENDDSKNGWNVIHLMPLSKNGIQITLDLHHSLFCQSGLTPLEEFQVVKPTWGNKWQEIHYSESADPTKLVSAHSDYYINKLPQFLENESKVYVHLECKKKELALLRYRWETLNV